MTNADNLCSKTVLAYLETRNRAIQYFIAKLQQSLDHAPEGSLRVIRNRRQYQFFHRLSKQDKKGTYILRQNRELAARLAQKDYDGKLLEALNEQQRVIQSFLEHYNPDVVREVYAGLTEARKQLVEKGFLTDEEFVEKWIGEPYPKMGFNVDDPEYYTSRGERVRSKSEVLIAEALTRHNIPYRYEYPVFDGNRMIGVPDFNCLNVRLRKDYYWEHLGMLGDQEYAERNVKKIEKYTLAESFDESRLILTFETQKHPLNTKVVEEKIRRYLL